MLCLICDRAAGHRYACHHCTDQMRRQLRELEDYAVILAATVGPLRGGPARRSPGYGSKSPARDDVIVMLDYRSRTGGEGDDDEESPMRSLVGGIRTLACWLREEAEQSDPRRWTLTSEIAYLLGRIESCAMEQWVDELSSDIRELHGQARALSHDQPTGPLGTCLGVGCGGQVYRLTMPGDDGARCSVCLRLYDGLDLVRLGAQGA
jgi:hypothetical protein